jgi:hypothetical protein
MAKTVIGDACAHMLPARAGEKARYVRIGTAVQDDDGRISLKVDTLPVPNTGWSGWINIFTRDSSGQPPRPASTSEAAAPRIGIAALDDDDVPF